MFFLKLKSFLRDYFTLTSRERKGTLALTVIISCQILVIIRLHYLTPPVEPVISTYRLQLEAYDKKVADSDLRRTKTFNEEPPDSRAIPVLTPFNPNTISDEQWISMGLTGKQANVIRNYLNKGGRFRDKVSVSKMYCISPELYQRMEPWISIPENEKSIETISPRDSHPAKKILKVDVNSADTLLLAELPLVGPGRARLIYKYRERLGGFISESQLLEVFTIDSATFQAIIPHIVVDAGKIRKLNMNSDSLYHPYLNKRVAAAIVSYRKQHGNFIDINGLRKVALLDEQMWLKVAPYAVFE